LDAAAAAFHSLCSKAADAHSSLLNAGTPAPPVICGDPCLCGIGTAWGQPNKKWIIFNLAEIHNAAEYYILSQGRSIGPRQAWCSMDVRT
jgi:hypothetical protein